jgi:23S rRNA (adenine2030-N6)-methyltransferase
VNYRHAFHAGNFADVHKHTVLLALLSRLKSKPTPFFYLDTHAGRGWYDLRGAEAARGDEWSGGIGRLLETQPRSEILRSYVTTVRSLSGATHERYPGSPVLALEHMRPNDRIVAIERQAQEADALRAALRGHRGVSIVCDDGYAALKAHLPPQENRGLVLIDPPYESATEFADVARALQFGLGRWRNGSFALWYPLKAGHEAQRLQTTLQESGLRKLLILELSVRPTDSPLGLNGSGLILANPPWQFDVEMRPALEELQALLAPDSGGVRVAWLVTE